MSREVLDVCFKSQMLSEMSPNCLLVGPETMNLPSPDPGASAKGSPQNPLKTNLQKGYHNVVQELLHASQSGDNSMKNRVLGPPGPGFHDI